jgi:osmotically-inducible protein OsmY
MKTKKLKKTIEGLRMVIFSLILLSSMSYLFAQDELTDLEISTTVDSQLMINATTPAHMIDVVTLEGIVTLSGTVNNLLAKDHAVKVAQMVKGVRGVIDKIEVATTYLQDDVLENNIKDALFKDPATSSYQITADANDGIVTLYGVVDSWQEKQIASHVAKGILGVKKVNNNLAIDIKTERPDFEITQEIKQALKFDVRVDHVLIDVNVREGNVTLSGTVGSIPEKNIAISNAWVAGVNSLDSDDLEVMEWARIDDLRKDKYVKKTDQEIKDAILKAFLYDPRVLHFNPDVSVNNGNVTLSGVVSNLQAKNAAENTARNVVGVFGVNNNLKVRPESIPQDSELVENISEAIEQSPVLENQHIRVSANNGIVFLTGVVNSSFEKLMAETIVSRTEGVVEVNNHLDVLGGENNTYFGYYDWNTYFPPLYDIKPLRLRSDQEIKSRIENQLWWSPYVNLDDIDVTVIGGKAILEGMVETPRESQFAVINAIEGGAMEVENNLVVLYTTP